MLPIKKFVIGIKPSQKIFRFSSIGGLIMDDILAIRGTKNISSQYFTEVTKAGDSSSFGLKNEEEGNEFKVDPENIVFYKNFYNSEKKIEITDCLQEFRAIWKVLNGHLKLNDIRRIGIVAEHQFPLGETSEQANAALLKGLTTLESNNHPAKFQLHFEERRHDKHLIDLLKDHFINVIVDYYDSSADSDHPLDGYANLNIDLQKYFSPLFTGNPFDEVFIMLKTLNEEKARLEKDLSAKGLL